MANRAPNIMWLRRVVILVFIISLLSVWFVVNSYQTNKQINKFGEKLAEWSYHHQKTIKINGKAINITGGPMWAYGPGSSDGLRGSFCRGTTQVYWQTDLATDDDNRAVRENLTSLVQQSDCNPQVLLACTQKLDEFGELMRVTAEELAEELSCLGQFQFASVEIK